MSSVNVMSFAINRIAGDYGVDYSMVENLLRMVVTGSDLSKLSAEKIMQIWDRDCCEALENQLSDLGFAA